MKAYKTTGKTLNDSYLNAPRQSCKPADYSTGERAIIEHQGEAYERTIHKRVVWRNSKPYTVWSRFAIINGQFLEVEEMEAIIEFEAFPEVYLVTPAWGCVRFENGILVDSVWGYDTPMEAWEAMKKGMEV